MDLSKKPVDCIFIGTTSLAIQCLDLLIKDGIKINCIISNDSKIIKYAKKNLIPHYDYPDFKFLENYCSDYIFSVVNPFILSQDILNLAKKLAINYHNSYLPRYAGVYATSWAIYNNEPNHAITWHLMDRGIDTGDIIKQKIFPIPPQVTAFELNLLCYEYAFSSFKELISELTNSHFTLSQQDLSQRSYYGFSDKPITLGLINWNNSLQDISRHIRSFSLGNEVNKLAYPYTICQNIIIGIKNIAETKLASTLSPGSFFFKDEDFYVCTKDYDLIIKEYSLLNDHLSSSFTKSTYQNPAKFVSPGKNKTTLFSTTIKATLACEDYWNKIIENSTTISNCFIKQHSDQRRLLHLWTTEFDKKSTSFNNEYLLAILLIYLFRINNYESFSCILDSYYPLKKTISNLIYPNTCPLNIVINPKFEALIIINQLLKTIKEHDNHCPMSFDWLLRNQEMIRRLDTINVMIIRSKPGNIENFHFIQNKIIFFLFNNTISCYLTYTLDDTSIHLLNRTPNHLKNLIYSITNNHNQLLTNISFLSKEEYDLIIANSIKKQSFYPNKNFIELFDETAQRYPRNTAITSGDYSINYKQLQIYTIQLASYIRSYPQLIDNKFIGIHCQRGEYYIIGVLATWRAGFAYTPIDADAAPLLKTYIIENTKSCLIISDHSDSFSVMPNLPIIHINKILTETNTPTIPISYINNNLAYAMHTSGSSGKPKSVSIQQNSFVNLCYWYAEKFLTCYDSILIITKLTFDLTQKNLFSPLLKGSRICFIKNKFFDPKEINDYIQTQKISMINCTPSIFYALQANDIKYKKLMSLHTLVLGAEHISTEKFLELLKSNKKLRIFNTYGPAEATDITTCYDITNKDIKTVKPIPIGRPINNVNTFVLDKYQQLMPIGIAGELHVAGLSVGIEYLQMPQKTQEKFISLLINNNHIRAYKTADLVKLLPTGDLIFINRLDTRLKILGQTIDPGEIVTVLNNLTIVTESAIIAKEVYNSIQLHAYVVLKKDKGNSVTTNFIRKHLENKLPKHYLPHRIFIIDHMPITGNGKIDLKQLAELQLPLLISDKELTPTQTRVVSLCRELLQTSSISIDDNFFTVGGDSLSATQFINGIYQQLNIKLEIRQLYDTPFLFSIAKLIDSGTRVTERTKKQTLYSHKRQYPLSFEQSRLFFIHQTYTLTHFLYYLPIIIQLDGSLDIEALQCAIQHTINQFQILRSHIELADNKPYHTELEHVEIKLKFISITKEKLEERIRIDYQLPINIHNPPPLNTFLYSLNNLQHVLFINLHHLFFDGGSAEIFSQVVSNSYHSIIKQEKLNTFKNIPYSNYVEKQANYAKTTKFSHSLKKYIAHASSAENLQLPYQDTIDEHSAFVGKQLDKLLSTDIVIQIKQLCLKQNVSAHTILAAVTTLLLYYHCKSNSIALGSPVSTRIDQRSKLIVGLMTNMVVTVNRIDPKKAIDHFLQQVRDNIFESFDWREIPFDALIAHCQIERHPFITPLVQVCIEYVTASMLNSWQLPGLAAKPLLVDFHTAKFPLTFRLIELEQKMMLQLEYNTNLFKEVQAEQFLEHWEIILNQIIKSPSMTIQQISLLTDKDYHRLKSYSISSQRTITHQLTDLIKDSINKYPHQIALQEVNSSLTYTELKQAIQQLTYYFIKHHLVNNSIIALYCHRSTDYIIAVLVCLYLRIPFLPIDIKLPIERIRYFLQHSNVTHLFYNSEVTINKQLLTILKELKITIIHPTQLLANWEKPITNTIFSNDLAYILFTSGSTGLPKAVMINHHALTNSLICFNTILQLNSKDKFLFNSSISFDISLGEFLTPLLSGGCVVISSDNKLNDLETTINLIQQFHVSVIQGTPSWIEQINKPIISTSPLKIVSVGEPLTTTLAHDLIKPNINLFNFYGPTEAAIYATYFKTTSINHSYNYIPIGKPFTNTAAYVLDENLQPIPENIPGELFLSGINLSLGYYNSPEENKAKFIHHTVFGKKEILYKTGDLVQWLPDGNLLYINRIGRPIKLNGYRIDLSEIENKIQEIDNIKDVVVTIEDSQELPKRQLLTAFITYHGTLSDQQLFSTITQHLFNTLPQYMLPVKYLLLDTIPMTVSNKIDYNLLSNIIKNELQKNHESVGTLDIPMEMELKNIMSKILSRPIINSKLNFFDMGGNSYTAVKLCHTINSYFNANLSVIDIFRAPTIHLLGLLLSKKPIANNSLSVKHKRKSISHLKKRKIAIL